MIFFSEILTSGAGGDKLRQLVEIKYGVVMNLASITSDSSFLTSKSVADQLVTQLESRIIRTSVGFVKFSDKGEAYWRFDSPVAQNVREQRNLINLLTKEGISWFMFI